MSKDLTVSFVYADENVSAGIKKAGQIMDDTTYSGGSVNMWNYSLSEQLDIEILKIENMISCLERLERQLEVRQSQTIPSGESQVINFL